MTYTIHQVLGVCHSFGMSEAERDDFERRLRFPHTGAQVLEHPKFAITLYIKLRDLGLDDTQVVEVMEAMR